MSSDGKYFIEALYPEYVQRGSILLRVFFYDLSIFCTPSTNYPIWSLKMHICTPHTGVLRSTNSFYKFKYSEYKLNYDLELSLYNIYGMHTSEQVTDTPSQKILRSQKRILGSQRRILGSQKRILGMNCYTHTQIKSTPRIEKSPTPYLELGILGTNTNVYY